MISQMNAVHDAARLAMGDHRAATMRRPRNRVLSRRGTVYAIGATVLAVVLAGGLPLTF